VSKIGSYSWGLGPDGLSQKCLNLPPQDVTHKNPKFKTFYFLKIQPRQLATSFDRLNSSLAQLPSKLESCKVVRK